MKTPTDKQMHLLALAVAISSVESRAHSRLGRSMLLSAAAFVFRAASLDVLLTASLVLAAREFLPGCLDIFRAWLLRRAFGNVDCG